MRGRPQGTGGRGTASTTIAAGLVRADDVLAPILAEGVHLLPLPLVVPEELADNEYQGIGATELIVGNIQLHQPVLGPNGDHGYRRLTEMCRVAPRTAVSRPR